MLTYLEMMNSVNMALANKDNERLQRLNIMDHYMFIEVIKDLEEIMEIDLSEYRKWGIIEVIDKIIMWLCHIRYKKYGMPIFYIKGNGKDYPKQLLYTEDENVYQRMSEF